MGKIVLAWLALLALLALELGAALLLPMSHAVRPLILVPAVVMLGVIVTSFMQVRQGPPLVRLFAVAGVLWLAILLALGSLDPLTRVMYRVSPSAPDALLPGRQ